jgi:hypothetical protein
MRLLQTKLIWKFDYVFNGEDSLPEIDGDETLRNAARAVRAYLETLETGK